MRIWRICRERHAAGSFTGEGARRFGGRWNSRGVPMVYASSSLALAAIELFVHLEPAQAPADLVSIAATLPEGEPARTITPDELPPDWLADPAGKLRALGDEWMASLSSLALLVPSAPIPHERNVLVNPLHPRMTEVRINPPQPFIFGARIFAR